MSTFFTTLDYPASCLALSPDLKQVVIAGSHVFKIFTIEEGKFTEKLNLYAPKSKNVQTSFSSSDVAWNQIDENRLATVASNGSVVTWNLQKPSRSKLDLIYKDHEKPVNKVNFHSTDPNLLISGSRAGVIKLFDLRERDAVSQFARNPGNHECVRDVQFNPHRFNTFAAVTEGGNIQIWDMRKTEKVEQFFTGHNDSVFAFDWHPEIKSRFATASRDRSIKIWDLTDSGQAIEDKKIRTAASVGRVKWRPDKTHHIASCGLTIGSISVWDVRRPYIPYATFNEHSNSSTGIVWQGHTSNLLSVGKDNTLYYHVFGDAIHPSEKANPVGLNISPHFDICSAKPAGNQRVSVAAGRNKSKYSDDTFEPIDSNLCVYSMTDVNEFGSNSIKQFALDYKLTGRSIADMCSHNADVARKLEQHEIAASWSIIQIIYGAENECLPSHSLRDDSKSEASIESDMKQSVRHYSGETIEASGAVCDDFEPELEDPETPDKLIQIAKGTNFFFYGEGDIPPVAVDDDKSRGIGASKVEFQLPDEAIVSRQDVDRRNGPLPPVPEEEDITDDRTNNARPSSGTGEQSSQDDDSMNEYFEVVIEEEKNFELNTNISLPSPPNMDFTDILKQTLEYFAAKGDVQFSVSLILVLGDISKGLIQRSVMEEWFLSYIDILHRLKLWNTATEIINLAAEIPYVNRLNLESTHYHIYCGTCQIQMPNGRYSCKKCNTVPPICSICHVAVHGIYTWCQGCAHGGHIEHIRDWMAISDQCPTGCGHVCEFT